MNKANVWGSQIQWSLRVGDDTNYMIQLPAPDPTAITRALAKFQELSTFNGSLSDWIFSPTRKPKR